MKKVFLLIIFIMSVFTINVYATNDVEYNLEITKDYDFKETIKYSLTDYKTVENGYNYFSGIINEPVYTDIFYNTKYKKTKYKSNGKYYVILSHTYTEYTMSNANFLNNCFEKHDYTYDIDSISFKGDNGFICLYGDSLKINITTDFEVVDTNANISDNIYTWKPTNNKFNMYFKFNKTYPEAEPTEHSEAGVIHKQDQETQQEDKEDQKEATKQESKINPIIIIAIISSIIVFGLIVAVILKSKKSNLNKI